MDSTELVGSVSNQTSVSAPTVRKKVTFDLDVQVHTIPKRIPVYERHPASSPVRSGHRPLFPRPSQYGNKNFFGNATSKHIVGLFSSTNGTRNAFNPRTYHNTRGSARQPQTMPSIFNFAAKNLYSMSTLKQTGKLSHAAANFKQISAALGGDIDDSAYREYKDGVRRIHSADAPQKEPNVQSHTRGIPDLKQSQGPTWKISSHSPTPSMPHYKPTGGQFKALNTQDNMSRPVIDDSEAAMERSPVLFKLQTISLNDPSRHNYFNPKPPPKRDFCTQYRQTNLGAYRLSKGETQGLQDDRSPSRCSTIETYVISENMRKKNTTGVTDGRTVCTTRQVAWAPRNPVLDSTCVRNISSEVSNSATTTRPTPKINTNGV